MTGQSFWLSTKGIAALAFIVAVSYFLLIEHRQHLYEWLPFLIIGLCPLMHLFMHRGHSHEGHHHSDQDNIEERERAAYQRGMEDAKKLSDRDNPEEV